MRRSHLSRCDRVHYAYAESLVLAYDKVVKLVEVMNAKKDGHKWQVKCIENWPAS